MRVPPIGPYLLAGVFLLLWWETGSLLVAVALMGLSLVLALGYGGAMGHSR